MSYDTANVAVRINGSSVDGRCFQVRIVSIQSRAPPFWIILSTRKKNSPAVCIGLTPGGARRLPWFRKEFRLFFLSFFNLKSADSNFFDVCKPYYK